ncbi:MAG: sensor histidine kinase [Candidatus Eisenbacteria bacterium]|nr:sensor histidine kinase [Candidatus Eisenbacteria bacterium]
MPHRDARRFPGFEIGREPKTRTRMAPTASSIRQRLRPPHAIQIPVLAALFAGHLLAHFFSDPMLHQLHEFLFKSTYIQIILAALWYGLRGGLIMSLATTVAYIFHIEFQLRGHVGHETLSLLLDVLLYNIVAAVTGVLAGRQRRARRELEQAKQKLEASLLELRRRTGDLLRAQEMLRRADQLRGLGMMAAGMAHELRNPLAGIRGAVEILERDSVSGERRREFAGILHKETARLDRVITSFLDFARPKPAAEAEVTLGEVMERISRLLEGTCRRQSIRLAGDALGSRLRLRIDPEILQQILLNLMLNGVQAMPGGGILRVDARIAPRPADTSGEEPDSRAEAPRREGGGARPLEIRVSDTGAGIPEQFRRQIFDPFFTTRDEGTGLGLPIVARLMAELGGELELEETGPAGTTFRLAFPGSDHAA